MNHEQRILAAAIQDRSAFNSISAAIREGDLTESAELVWDQLGGFYGRDHSAGRADVELLSRSVGRVVSSDKHKDQFVSLVHELGAAEISPANVMYDFIQVRKESLGDQLASAILGGRDASELIEEYQRWGSAESLLEGADEDIELRNDCDVSDILTRDNPDALLKLLPESLNERLDGGLLRGHHVVVFARPEMGKTLFVVNAMAGFMKQGLRVFYVCNEEPLDMTEQRLLSRVTNMDKTAIALDPVGAMDLARRNGVWQNWWGVRLAPGSPQQISGLCDKINPDVLVIDQLRNLRMKEDNYVQKLEKAASAARALGQQHDCLVISVTQAGDSATDRPVLDLGDVDSSNTGIPAQADVMVGISCTPEDKEFGRRVISLPKNKRSGNHDHFAVKIDPTVSRMITI